MKLNENIKENELLYRAIKRSKPDCICNGRISPALYKYEKRGISVDRDGNRDQSAIISFMCENISLFPKVKAIAELSAKKCIDFGTKLVADPPEDGHNPYHANIFLDEDEKIQNIQAELKK